MKCSNDWRKQGNELTSKQGNNEMKQFIAFIRKEFYHILRDKRTMLILLGMPIVQIILFGFAISTEVKNVRTAILSPSYDIAVQQIAEQLGANEYFQITEVVRSPEELQDEFRKGNIDLAIVFPSQYTNHSYKEGEAIQIIADASEPNLALTRSNYAQNILAQAENELKGIAIQPTVIPNLKLLYNPQMKSAYNFVPGVMGLILMIICAMMTSVAIVREKETGTMEILLVSPVRPIFVILSKAVPYLVLSLVNLATILLLSRFVLNVPVAGSIIGLLFVSLLFILVSLALGLFISCLAKTQAAALLISAMVLMIPTILLSGMIFNIESMPGILQMLSYFIPARWYIDLVRKIMIEGVPMHYVWNEVGILLLMLVIFVGISLRLFKNRLN